MIKLRQTLGDLTVEVEADTPTKAISQLNFWNSLPPVCPDCESELRLFFKNPSGNEYYGLRCIGPVPHEANFGIRKEDRGLYYKGDESFEIAYGFRPE